MSERRHPLVDDELRDTRIRGRKALACLGDWEIERYAPPPAQPYSGGNAMTIERALRRLADKLLENPDVQEVLERSGRLNPLDLTLRFIQDRANQADDPKSAPGRDPRTPRTPHLNDWAWDIVGDLEAESREIPGGPRASEVRTDAKFAQLVALLVWADELAEDAYRDPRLVTRLVTDSP
jgi:hypothetical protein